MNKAKQQLGSRSKGRLGQLVTLILCLFLNGAWAATNLKITILPKQTSFRVKLKANPTTGYQWQVKKYDKKLLVLEEANYVSAESKLIGSGGEMIFNFKIGKKAIRPKKTRILLEYCRPWEKKQGAIKEEVVVQFKK